MTRAGGEGASHPRARRGAVTRTRGQQAHLQPADLGKTTERWTREQERESSAQTSTRVFQKVFSEGAPPRAYVKPRIKDPETRSKIRSTPKMRFTKHGGS